MALLHFTDEESWGTDRVTGSKLQHSQEVMAMKFEPRTFLYTVLYFLPICVPNTILGVPI